MSADRIAGLYTLAARAEHAILLLLNGNRSLVDLNTGAVVIPSAPIESKTWDLNLDQLNSRVHKARKTLTAEAALVGVVVETIWGAAGYHKYLVRRGAQVVDCDTLSAARVAVQRLQEGVNRAHQPN